MVIKNQIKISPEPTECVNRLVRQIFQDFVLLHRRWDLICLRNKFGLDLIRIYMHQTLPIDFHNVPIDWAYEVHPPWCIFGPCKSITWVNLPKVSRKSIISFFRETQHLHSSLEFLILVISILNYSWISVRCLNESLRPRLSSLSLLFFQLIDCSFKKVVHKMV